MRSNFEQPLLQVLGSEISASFDMGQPIVDDAVDLPIRSISAA